MAKKKKPGQNRGRQQPQGRPTKAERRDDARRERQAIMQQMARRKRNGRIAAGSLVAVGAVLAIVLVTQGGSSSKVTPSPSEPPTVSPDTLAGIIKSNDTSTWTNNTTDLAQRLAVLQLGTPAETVLHIHAHLDLYVNGQQIQIPANIGLASNAESPIHVHDGEPGVIHIESASANAQYSLGNFFNVWGLKLTSTCLGGYCNNKGSTLTAYVNGQPYTGDPSQITLTSHEEIVLAYGTSSQLPNPIPSSFDFSQYGLTT